MTSAPALAPTDPRAIAILALQRALLASHATITAGSEFAVAKFREYVVQGLEPTFVSPAAIWIT